MNEAAVALIMVVQRFAKPGRIVCDSVTQGRAATAPAFRRPRHPCRGEEGSVAIKLCLGQAAKGGDGRFSNCGHKARMGQGSRRPNDFWRALPSRDLSDRGRTGADKADVVGSSHPGPTNSAAEILNHLSPEMLRGIISDVEARNENDTYVASRRDALRSRCGPGLMPGDIVS